MTALGPSHLFQPIIMTFNANAQLLEIDIARTYLVCTLFAKGIGKMHGGTSAYMIWDEKWIYIATHFVRKDSFLVGIP